MSILESVLANTNTGNGPRIVGENHDINRINWVAGMSDPGEMIACGAYQELRRQRGEADEAYQERIEALLQNLPAEHAARIRAACAPAAIRRAGLDTSNGRVNVVVAGKAPWHALGVHIEEATDSNHALALSGTDWTTSKIQLRYIDNTGVVRPAPGVFGIVRNDTHEMLGTVGSRYEDIQNRNCFEFMDQVLGNFGAKYEAAGSIYGGQKVFMLVRLPRQSFTIGTGDVTEAYAMFTNPHDGSGRAFCFPTSERVVCANTYRVAFGKKAGKGIGIRHTGNVKARIEDAQIALDLAVKGFDRFAEDSKAMAATSLGKNGIRNYANDILDAVLDITAAEAMQGADVLAKILAVGQAERDLKEKEIAKKIERRVEILEDILSVYEEPSNGLNGMRGTVYGGFQTITNWCDHGQRYTGSDLARASRRFESAIAGDMDDVKQQAYRTALDYMRA